MNKALIRPDWNVPSSFEFLTITVRFGLVCVA